MLSRRERTGGRSWGWEASSRAEDLPRFAWTPSYGRGNEVLTGCIRKNGEAFLVVEAGIPDIAGVRATWYPDKPSGQELLTVE